MQRRFPSPTAQCTGRGRGRQLLWGRCWWRAAPGAEAAAWGRVQQQQGAGMAQGAELAQGAGLAQGDPHPQQQQRLGRPRPRSVVGGQQRTLQLWWMQQDWGWALALLRPPLQQRRQQRQWLKQLSHPQWQQQQQRQQQQVQQRLLQLLLLHPPGAAACGVLQRGPPEPRPPPAPPRACARARPRGPPQPLRAPVPRRARGAGAQGQRQGRAGHARCHLTGWRCRCGERGAPAHSSPPPGAAQPQLPELTPQGGQPRARQPGSGPHSQPFQSAAALKLA